jgi:hypothetical protein
VTIDYTGSGLNTLGSCWTVRPSVYGPIIRGAYTTVTCIDDTTPPKEAMNVPEPKSCDCPRCQHRAVKAASGNDWTMDVVDHDVTREKDKTTAKENGARARLRICAKCGHVWATILSVTEV